MFHFAKQHFPALLAISLLAMTPLAGVEAAENDWLVQAAEDDWVAVSGGGLTVYLPVQPDQAEAAHRLVAAVDGRRQLLEAVLEKSFPPSSPVAIYLFPDAAAAQPYGAAPESPRRLRLPQGTIVVAAGPLEPQRKTLERFAVEGLLDGQLGRLPAAWRAGFAQFLLEAEVDGAAARPIASAELLALLRNQSWLPVVQYSDLDFAGQSPEVRRQLAAQLWALIFRDVVVDPQRKARLQGFVRRVLDGERASAAFQAVYLAQVDTFLGEVRDAVRKTGAGSFSDAAASYPVAPPPFGAKNLAGADREATLAKLQSDLATPPPPPPAEPGLAEQANELIAEGDYPAALEILQKVRQQATEPGAAEALDAKIAELRRTISQNAFAKGYSAAVEHYNAQRWKEAIAALQALLPTLTDAEAKKKTADLLAKAKTNKQAGDKAELHNQFVEAYKKATDLYNAKKLKEAAAILDKQLALPLSPEDQKVAKTFLALCRPAGG